MAAKDIPMTIKQIPIVPIFLNLCAILGRSSPFDINTKKGKDIKKVPKTIRLTF